MGIATLAIVPSFVLALFFHSIFKRAWLAHVLTMVGVVFVALVMASSHIGTFLSEAALFVVGMASLVSLLISVVVGRLLRQKGKSKTKA